MSHTQYITNKKGKKQFVILPIKEYKKLLEEIESLIKFSSEKADISPNEKVETPKVEEPVKKVAPVKKAAPAKKATAPKKAVVAKKAAPKAAVKGKKK
jgi:hypothetical protein